MTTTAQDGDIHGASLERMSEEILRGVSGAQIRKMVIPSQLMRMQQTLSSGNAEDVSFLMRDVVGEGISLAAGGSIGGGEAMQALSLAQAQCFVDLRLRKPSLDGQDTLAWAELMAEHRASLIEWVRSGVVGTEKNQPVTCLPSDLTRIGQEFLTVAETRKAAISIFIAATAVIQAGLTIFTSAQH